MWKDSKGRTEDKAVKEIATKAWLECLNAPDVVQAYVRLMDMVNNGKPDLALKAIEIMLKYSVRQPKQETDITTNGKDLDFRVVIERKPEEA